MPLGFVPDARATAAGFGVLDFLLPLLVQLRTPQPPANGGTSGPGKPTTGIAPPPPPPDAGVPTIFDGAAAIQSLIASVVPLTIPDKPSSLIAALIAQPTVLGQATFDLSAILAAYYPALSSVLGKLLDHSA